MDADDDWYDDRPPDVTHRELKMFYEALMKLAPLWFWADDGRYFYVEPTP